MTDDRWSGKGNDRVAVVGIGCRLPGARDHHEFYANLRQGVCSVREITADRWDVDEFYSPDITVPNRSISKWCGLIDSPYAFDHAFFHISPREAELMDPQQRLLLEQGWRCVEDSGTRMADLRRARTSVFVGVMGRDHLQAVSDPTAPVESHSAVGAYDSMLANRVSHALGLRGASLSVDAACASSLVAIHLGVRALLDDEADYVLAGGVSLNLHPWKYISFSKARMLSPRGLCRTFDRTADGYVPGDGAAMVLLRRLGDAERDGDHIYGLVAGSAVNHGGRRPTITAPTVESQREAVQTALARAAFDPSSVSYVEAHGTGTSLGDPVEVQALRQVFESPSFGGPWCTLGSVKPNIGHLEAAAGIAGLVKVLMMLQGRRIPPSIHVDAPNPLIDLSTGPFRLATSEQPWVTHRGSGPLRGGVSSFGMGGVNAHVCVEEYRPPGTRGGPASPSSRYPLLLSARTPQALDRLIERWREPSQRSRTADPADICGTLARGREHFAVRVGALVKSRDDIAAVLADVRAEAANEPTTAWWIRVGPSPVEPPTRRWNELLDGGPLADVTRSTVDESPALAPILHRLAHGQWGAGEACLFTYFVLRFFLRMGLRPQALTATGPGLWPALAAAGALAPRAAVDLATGSAAPLELQAPALVFRGPSPEQAIRPSTMDEAYLGDLLGDARVTPAEFATLRDRAAALVEQHTYRANLQEWHQAWEARGLGRLRLPLDGRALAAVSTGQALDTLIRVLAMHHALDRLNRKWSLPRLLLVGDPRVRELLDLLLDGLCLPEELLAFAYGGTDEQRSAAGSAQRRADKMSVDLHRYPILARHSGDRAGSSATAAWVDRLRDPEAVLPAPPDGMGVLDIAGARAAPSTRRAITVTTASVTTDRAAQPLLDLWLAGVDIDWDMYWSDRPVSKLSLPAYEFDRIEHRTPRRLPRATAAGAEPVEVTARWTRVDEHGLDHVADPAAPVLVVTPAGGAGVEQAAALGLGTEPILMTVDALADVDRPPHRIVLLAPEVSTGDDEADEDGMASTILLMRTLLRLADEAPIRVLLAQPRGARQPRPEWTSFTGLAACLAHETSRLRLTCVLADSAADDPAMWSALRTEFGQTDTPFLVRYESGRRQIREYQPAPTGTAPRSELAHTGVRRDGVYLITGGAGGLGRKLAAHLLAVPGVRVALAGRSPAPPDLVPTVAAEAGTDAQRLLYHQTDVTLQDQVEELLRTVWAAFGPLNGVFHAAGALRDRLLKDKSPQDVHTVLAPKVRGTRNLDHATRHEPLDFFALFSSVVSVIGNAGQADYAVANAFLGEFAEQRESWRAAGRRTGTTVAVDWPLWDGGGMRVPEIGASVFRPVTGLSAMPVDVGLRLLDDALRGGGRRTYLFGDRERAVRLLAGQVRPSASAEAGAAPATTREQALAFLRSLFAELLHVPPDDLDSDLPFDQYGVDSIFVAQANTRLERDWGPVPHTLLFECRTLDQVADRLARPRSSRSADPPVRPGRPAAGIPAADQPTGSAVAVIGMAGRYPMAPDVAAFWRQLSAGQDCVSEIPPARWDRWRHGLAVPADPADNGIHRLRGGFLDDVDSFDPLFFNISPREAEVMDPQERLFLETAWHTFEDAGWPPHRLGNPNRHGDRAVGVFVGVTTQSYLLWGPDQSRAGHAAIPTSTPWSIANRVSHCFDLHGPSMPVDAACASSLSAVHLACESLARGECRMALAGGVNLYLHPVKYERLRQRQMLAPQGRRHAFGDQTNGFVPGEGVGAVLLKPLHAALADGDKILGVIRGTAVNHGGRTNSSAAPGPSAQAELMRSALRRAGIAPGGVTYVEAHGTGTALGDPIEIAGLAQAYGAAPEGAPAADGAVGECAIGSVTTNIGHLESAAGIAGLTKVLLQLRHRALAPSLHAEGPNPRIDLTASRLRLQRTLAAWPASAAAGSDGERLPRRAGISSFGAGGVNAHAIVEEFSTTEPPPHDVPGEHLVTVSAHDAERLRAHCAGLAASLRGRSDVTLAEAAHQLQVRREPLRERCAVLVTSLAKLVEILDAIAAGQPPGDHCWRTDPASRRRRNAENYDQQVARALAERDLAVLAAFWVAGAAVTWEALYPAPLRHVDLPGYPFGAERYWLPPAAA